MKTLKIESPAFGMNESIPRQYTVDGRNTSPPLRWSDLPAGTKELALIVDDPDAPVGTWVHWLLYRVPTDSNELPENILPSLRVDKPGGALQGKNSWGNVGYGGPAPPRGHGMHHYHFRLYALDLKLNLDPGASKEALLEAMSGHILAEGELVGTYQR